MNSGKDDLIKTRVLPSDWSKLYTRLSDARQESDYAPFASFDREDIAPLLPKTEEFIEVIKRLIQPT